MSVDKKILRTAEGRQQRAADSRDIFHADDRQDIPLLAARAEKDNRQRHKYDQRNVVGDEHRGKEYREHQKQRQPRHGANVTCQPEQRTEDVFLFEALEHRQHHKQRAERTPVDIRQQLP